MRCPLPRYQKNRDCLISTASRIIAVLTKYNYLNQREKRGKYSIGEIYLTFNNAINNKVKVRNIAIPHLNNLSRETNELSAIAFTNGTGEVSVEGFEDYVKPEGILRISMNEVLGKTPIHCSSLGKIILASFLDSEIKDYFDRTELHQYTPNTIIDVNKINSTLRKVRKEKFAMDNEELFLGVRSIATGIEDSKGKVIGSIGIIAPAVRFTSAKINSALPALIKCADDISNELKDHVIYF